MTIGIQSLDFGTVTVAVPVVQESMILFHECHNQATAKKCSISVEKFCVLSTCHVDNTTHKMTTHIERFFAYCIEKNTTSDAELFENSLCAQAKQSTF